MVKTHLSCWWYCLNCKALFKLPKATYYSYHKIEVPIYCPLCGKSNTRESFKDYYKFNPEVKKR